MDLPSTPAAIINVHADDASIMDQEYPPNLLAHSRPVRRPVGAGDTIVIDGVGEVGHPFRKLYGRILRIEVDASSIASLGVPYHPFVDPTILSPNDALCIMQIFITNTQSTLLQPTTTWRVHDYNTRLSTHGLIECAGSNLLVWISPSQIISMIAILHADDIIHQLCGPVADRDCTLFTISTVIFNFPEGEWGS